ncbi:hypothetical protein GP486_001998 [Trichoglossum hirsutum]|uniref:Uncharacterized protein n=1 Tax=Trichoglossum hirsutum TaxID=265104 RepID=A0A9P8RS64_9PEZI|nr:hypothetical protein GP486_001998 [Trichoglossum hirsutum]
MSTQRLASKKSTIGMTKEPYDIMAMQGAWPANDKKVQEALHCIGRTQQENNDKEMTHRLATYGVPMVRQETLCQKADDEDEEAPGLIEAEFYEKIKDPRTLYRETVELIQRARDLKAISENYCTRHTTKLPDPPLFDGSTKDRVMYNNWLIQVKNKLCGNADAYPTEDLKIIYVAG